MIPNAGIQRGDFLPRAYLSRGQALLACALLPLSLLPAVHAAEVSGYLPLNLAPALEARVERLLVLAGTPVMARPIRVATVLAALPAACRADAELCIKVERDLEPWLRSAAITHGAASVAGSHEAATLLQPNQHGAPMDARWQASLGAYASIGPHLMLNAGAVAYPGRVNPSGSFVSAGGGRAQVDIGYRDHWWSPMRDSSMLLSTEAATMPSVTVANTAPLTRWGVNYEVFMGSLSYSRLISYHGGYTAGHPRLAGFHLELQPVPGWSLAASRLMQFGGGARGGNSLRDLGNAFFNTTAYENTTKRLTSDLEFGNQQVAFASELQVPGPRPMSVYVEYAAEDTWHAENYRFGSSALSAGLFLPALRPNLQLRYEFSEWQNNWYVHHIYRDGLSNYGAVLGNWAADWRQRGRSVGAQSQMLALDWQLDAGAALNVRYRTVLNGRGSGVDYRRAHDLTLEYSHPWRGLLLGGNVEGGRDEYGSSFARLGASLRLDGDGAGVWRARQAMAELADEQGSRSAPRSPTVPGAYERFVDGGVAVSHLRYEQDVGSVPSVKTLQGSAHLGLGLRRIGGAHSDFGARIEADNIKGRLFLGLRALDYRYRWGDSLALTSFFGFGRYAAQTPAYGYYLGVGAQWRNVLPGWDAGADFRYGDRLVRNKVLPGEKTIIWPNEFYTFKGYALYLSRRF